MKILLILISVYFMTACTWVKHHNDIETIVENGCKLERVIIDRRGDDKVRTEAECKDY